MKLVQVLKPNADEKAVQHFTKWFLDRGVRCEMQDTSKGQVLLREMPDDEFVKFMDLRQ